MHELLHVLCGCVAVVVPVAVASAAYMNCCLAAVLLLLVLLVLLLRLLLQQLLLLLLLWATSSLICHEWQNTVRSSFSGSSSGARGARRLEWKGSPREPGEVTAQCSTAKQKPEDDKAARASS